MVLPYLLFVLVGLGIGHLLWYRDRSAEQEEIRRLKKKADQLRALFRRKKQEHHQQAEDLKLRNKQWKQVQNEQLNMQRETRDLEIQVAEAIAAVELTEKQRDEAIESAKREAEHRDRVLDEIVDACKQKVAAESESTQYRRELEQLEQAHASLKHDYDTLRVKLQRIDEQSGSMDSVLRETRDKVLEAETQGHQLQQELEQATRENVALQFENDKICSENIELLQRVDSLSAAVEEKQEQLAQSSQGSQQYDKTLRIANEEIETLQQQHDSLTGKLSARDQELERLGQTVQQLREQSQLDVSRIQQSGETIARQKDEIEAGQRRIDQLTREHDAAIKRLEKQSERTEQQATEYESQLASATKIIEEIREAKAKALAGNSKHLESINASIAEQHSLLSAARAKIASLEQDNVSLVNDAEEQLAELDSALAVIAQQTQKLKRADQRIEELEQRCEDSEKSHATQVVELDQRCLYLSQNLSTAHQKSTNLTRKKLSLEKQLTIMEKRAAEYQELEACSQQEIKNLQDQLQDRDLQVSESTAMLSKSDQQLESLRDLVLKAEQENTRLQSDLEQSNEHSSELQDERSQLNEEIDQQQMELSAAEQSIDALQEQLISLEQKLKAITDEKQDSISSLRETESKLDETQKQLLDRNNELSDTNQRLRASEKELLEVKASLSERKMQLASVGGINVELQEKNVALCAIEQALNEQVLSLSSENRKQQSVIEQADCTIESLRSTNGDLQNTCRQQEAKLKSADTAMADMIQAKDDALKEVANFKQAQQESHEALSVLRSERKELSGAYEQLVNAYDEAEQDIKRLEDEIEEFEQQEVLFEETLQNQTDRVTHLISQRDSALQEVNDLTETLTEIKQQNTGRSDQLQQTQIEMSNLQAAKQTAESDLKTATEQLRQVQSELSESQESHQLLESDLKNASEDIGRLQAEVAENESRFDALKKELVASRADSTRNSEDVQQLREWVQRQAEENQKLQDAHRSTRDELVAAVEEHLDTARRLETAESELRSLRSAAGSFTKLQLRAESLEKQLDETTGHLQRVSEDYNASLDENAEAERRIIDLQHRLTDSADTIRKLRRDVGSPVEADANPAEEPQIIPFPRNNKAA